jgi:hypothetical protein
MMNLDYHFNLNMNIYIMDIYENNNHYNVVIIVIIVYHF